MKATRGLPGFAHADAAAPEREPTTTQNVQGDTLRSYMAVLRRLGKHEPYNTVALQQKIAQKVIEAGKYVVRGEPHN